MKAFVAGATGWTGRFVVEVLRERGVDVIAHVRPDSARLEEWRARFSARGAAVDASVWTSDAIAAALVEHRPSLVFGLLGTTRARAARTARAGGDPAAESYEAVDVALTEQLIRGARGVEPAPRFVYLSSVGAGPGARGSYLAARTRVESTLAASGLPFTIARPSFIVGERDDARPTERIVAPVADTLLSVLGVVGARRTAERYRSITGPELAAVLVALALDPAWSGRIAEAEDLQGLVRRRRG